MARNPLTTLSGTLRDAKALIERHGWSQGYNNNKGFGPINGALCIHDALVRCMGTKRREAMDALAEALDAYKTAHPPTRIPSIALVGWNDARGRTIAQVLAGFDKAIATAEAKGD